MINPMMKKGIKPPRQGRRETWESSFTDLRMDVGGSADGIWDTGVVILRPFRFSDDPSEVIR